MIKVFNKDNKTNINLQFFSAIVVLIFISLITGLILSITTNLQLSKQLSITAETDRPADIDIVVIKDSSCDECFNPATVIEEIRKQKIKVNSEKVIMADGEEGRELIDRLDISQVPTIVITGEIQKDQALQSFFSQLGDIKDGTLVLKPVFAPYVEVDSGEIRGLVKLTMITDVSCDDCYDVTVHENILPGLGFPVDNSEVFDAGLADGRILVNKYQIQLLPTIILTGDIDAYSAIKSVWSQIGTVESDGAYVFREGVKQMGIYKNSITGEIVRPTEASN